MGPEGACLQSSANLLLVKLPKSRLTASLRSFVHLFSHLLNQLPQSVQSHPSIISIKMTVQLILLSPPTHTLGEHDVCKSQVQMQWWQHMSDFTAGTRERPSGAMRGAHPRGSMDCGYINQPCSDYGTAVCLAKELGEERVKIVIIRRGV